MPRRRTRTDLRQLQVQRQGSVLDLNYQQQASAQTQHNLPIERQSSAEYRDNPPTISSILHPQLQPLPDTDNEMAAPIQMISLTREQFQAMA